MKKLLLVFMLCVPQLVLAEWNFDFSKRTKTLRTVDQKAPVHVGKSSSLFNMVFSSSDPIQELVVLNTDKGFVPSTLRVKSGGFYKIHIVNINEDEKNVSFVLDAFSEHHATYYGKVKSVVLQPKKAGIYTFVCPETSAQGRLVVYPATKTAPTRMRTPASE